MIFNLNWVSGNICCTYLAEVYRYGNRLENGKRYSYVLLEMINLNNWNVLEDVVDIQKSWPMFLIINLRYQNYNIYLLIHMIFDFRWGLFLKISMKNKFSQSVTSFSFLCLEWLYRLCIFENIYSEFKYNNWKATIN